MLIICTPHWCQFSFTWKNYWNNHLQGKPIKRFISQKFAFCDTNHFIGFPRPCKKPKRNTIASKDAGSLRMKSQIAVRMQTSMSTPQKLDERITMWRYYAGCISNFNAGSKNCFSAINKLLHTARKHNAVSDSEGKSRCAEIYTYLKKTFIQMKDIVASWILWISVPVRQAARCNVPWSAAELLNLLTFNTRDNGWSVQNNCIHPAHICCQKESTRICTCSPSFIEGWFCSSHDTNTSLVRC